ncbi:hypothetical protein SAMN04488054_1511, partial [Salibacterium qingdaonense]
IHGKDEVTGSNPVGSSMSKADTEQVPTILVPALFVWMRSVANKLQTFILGSIRFYLQLLLEFQG